MSLEHLEWEHTDRMLRDNDTNISARRM